MTDGRAAEAVEDAKATLRHIADDAEHRIAALDAMTVRREPSPRIVTQELVDRLRDTGADADSIAFAQRLVPVYGEDDKDRAIRAGLTVGCLLGVVLGVCATVAAVLIAGLP